MKSSIVRCSITALGVVLAFGFLSASAAMNWRYGISLGQTEIDQWTFGAVSVIADLFKVSLPFFIFWSARNRRLIVALTASVLWLLCTTYSITSGLGFSAVNRSITTAMRADAMQRFQELRDARNESVARLKVLGAARAAAVVSFKLEAMQSERAWQRTSRCTDATVTSSIAFCKRYYALQSEAAAAKSATQIRAEIARLDAQMKALRDRGVGVKSNPQADIVAHLLQVNLTSVSTALVVLLVVLVELGSGLGLFVCLNHGEGDPASVGERGTLTHSNLKPKRPPGDLAQYAVARLDLAHGISLEVPTLHNDYVSWCKDNRFEPLHVDAFEKTFADLCAEVGFDSRWDKQTLICVGLGKLA